MFQGASTPTTIADVSSTPETTGSITSSVPLPSSETQRTLISTEFESTTSLTYVHSTEKSSSLTTTIILTPDHTTNYQSTSLPEISSETSSDLTSTFHDFSTTRPETDVSQTLAPTEISTEGITTTGATTEVSTEATTDASTMIATQSTTQISTATETTMEVGTEVTTDATTEITTESSIASTSGATTQFTSAAETEVTTEVTTEGTSESTTILEETTDVTSTQVPTTEAETSAETTTTEVLVQWSDWGQWSEWTPTCYDDSADSIYKDSSKYYPKRSRTRDCIRTENGVNNVTVPVNDESGNCPFKDKLEKEKDEYHATGRFQYLTS